MTVSHKHPVTRWRHAASLVLLGLLAVLLAGCPDDDDGNTAPRAANDAATTTVAAPVTIRVLDNDSDADADSLTVTTITQGANGAVTNNNNGTVTYAPRAHFVGTDTFRYTVSDGQGGTAQASVAVTVTLGNNVQVIGLVDDGTTTSPIPNALCRFVNLAREVVARTTADPNGMYRLVLAPGLQGFVECAPPGLANLVLRTFVSTVGREGGTVIRGQDVLPATTVISDVLVAERVANPDVNLEARERALLNSLEAEEPRLTVLVAAATALFNALLEAELPVNFAAARADLYADGDVDAAALAPIANDVNTAVEDAEQANGVTVEDAFNQLSPVNVAPVAANDTATTEQDTASARIMVLDNDTDADSDALTITAATNGSNGTTRIDDTAIIYTPAPDFVGMDTFTYTISDGRETDTATVTVTVTATGFRLTVLHNNDGESQLIDAGSGLENFGGVARFASVVQRLRDDATVAGSRVVLLSSGDNFLAGPEFNASLSRTGNERVPFFDTIALDRIGYTAFAIGNHEFDFGPEVLGDFIRGFTAPAPFLSANLDFRGEPDLQDLVDAGRIAASMIATVDGRRIGIIGATTPRLPFISNPRNAVVNNDVAGAIQAEIDRLTAEGVNVLILISHLQSIEEDLALAPQLRNLDLMIAGGGDELLANPGTVLIPGDEGIVFGPYPLMATDADGNQLPVITTSGAYRYVGRLVIDLDAMGRMTTIDTTSGPVRVAGGNAPDAVTPDPAIQEQVVEPVQAAINDLDTTIIGTTEVPLNGVRSDVRTLETNEGNLIADALLFQATESAADLEAPQPDVALQNGGGIRNDTILSVGQLSELDTFDMLPFANFVAIVPHISATQFKEILENAVSRVEFTDGRFAQIAGFRFLWDPNGTPRVLDDEGNVTTPGTRIREVVLNDGRMLVQNGTVITGAPRVTIATINFLADGGDEYPFRAAPFFSAPVTYQQALVHYIQQGLDSTITAARYPAGGEGRIMRLPELAIATDSNPAVLGEVNDVTVFNGGFGSAMAPVPGTPGEFYLLTDRGPNVEGPEDDTIVFPFPDFTPQIGRFRVDGTTLQRRAVIGLRNASGGRLTGLPNPPGQGGTGETPLAPDLTPLDPDPEGVDSEGLVALADGTFWVSDEYGPHILHLDAHGNTIERINPFGTGTGGRRLPAVLAQRRPNRGMEGLTITPDGTTLVGLMQSPLDNPSREIRDTSRIARIVTFEIATGATQQFVYLLEAPDLVNSAIVALSNTTFLVLERDGDFPGDPDEPSALKRVFRINISQATNVNDPANGPNGLLVNGQTLEQLCRTTTCEEGLAAAGIVPVSKTLVVDLLALPTLYTHDKPEGLAVIDERTLAVVNDDDFGVADDDGQLIAKILPLTDAVARNEIWFVTLQNSFMPGPQVQITGVVDDGTTTSPITNATCQFVSLGNAVLAAARANATGVYTLTVDPGTQGFVECWPRGQRHLRLRSFVSMVGMVGGATLSGQDVSPATTVISGILQTTHANTPATDLETLEAALLADLAAGEANLAVLADAATALFNTMRDANLDTTPFDVALEDLLVDGEVNSAALAAIAPTVQEAVDAAAEARGTQVAAAFAVRSPAQRIRHIQGAAHRSLREGQTVSVPGIVTALASGGFYLQDPTPDSNAATSEGIFVFTSATPTVAVGDAVMVRGVVTEFRPGGSGGTGNLTTTELTTPSITVLSSNNPLPTATIIGVGGGIPPQAIIADDADGDAELTGTFDPATDGLDFYESLEGMLVQVNDAVAVSPTNAFGEIAVVSDNGANAGLRTPRGGIVIQPDDFNPERIILDDALISEVPAVNVGDRFTVPVVGVLDYSFGNFKLLNTAPLPAVTPGEAAQEVTSLTGSPNQLLVATFNVENLDNNPNDDDTADEDTARLARLAAIIVDHLGTPDIVALQEVQDNSGSIDNGAVDASRTYEALITAIEQAGGPTYDFRDIAPQDNQDGGQPGGNIRVGFLFNPQRVTFVDRGTATATTATAVVQGPSGPELTLSPGRIDPANVAFADSRKPLVAEFLFERQRLFLINNHFTSKGGSDPLFGRFHPPTNGGVEQREMQAQVVHDFVVEILAIDAAARVLVLGDLNEFQFLTPLQILAGGPDSILTNLTETLPDEERYTFIFDGNAQSLDHILISDSLNSLAEVDIVHVNAEFAARVSDHDPTVARFTFPVRFATFNASLNRASAGQLITDLSTLDNAQARVIAEIIQRANPDVVLINEFDFDPAGTAARLFADTYLGISQNGAAPVRYPFHYVAPSNTDLACPPTVVCDFDHDGVADTTPGDATYAADALGFGVFPGQFGMLVYTKFPIAEADVRTFKNFLWQDMPGALLPDDPATLAPDDWYTPEELSVFPLSSKSHWDVPVLINGRPVHVLVSHPTPPVFDGDEDRNGRRNHDEIRLWADYINGGARAAYLIDDNGTAGGLAAEDSFVIMGDQNADPFDGDSVDDAMLQLLNDPLINAEIDNGFTPASTGAEEQAALQGGANATHTGNPAFDTADFADNAPGNLRVDYVLPSADLSIVGSAVFWPVSTDPLFDLVGIFPFPSSDHRLVWVDVVIPR